MLLPKPCAGLSGHRILLDCIVQFYQVGHGCRASVGVRPKRSRNVRLKWAASLKPHEKAISLMLRLARLGSQRSR